MKRKIALILCLFFMFTLGVSSQVWASEGSGDYVIFRANVFPMYIRNVSAPIHVIAIPFHDNKPVYATLNLHINITGLNVNYSYKNIIQIHSGLAKTIYLPQMGEGHYDILIYAEFHGIISKVVNQDFAVVPAPLPYSLTFSNDGSQIVFTSKVLNQTGHIDPTKPFRLEIYLWDGTTQSLVSTYTNVTNLTINVPQSWRTGILIVDVIDMYGWVNGMSLDLSNFQFQGYPVEYDYQQSHRYPAAGYSWQWYLGVAITALIILYIGLRIDQRRWEYGGEE